MADVRAVTSSVLSCETTPLFPFPPFPLVLRATAQATMPSVLTEARGSAPHCLFISFLGEPAEID